MKHNTKIRFKLDIQFFAGTLDRTKIVSKIQTDSSDTFDIVPNKIANTSGNYYAELPTLTQNETIATGTQLATKQDTLVSGTNIKTINGQNILGSGNVTIDAGVSSVNGKTGAVTLTKGDVGLGNVDNTSDLNKPISTATQAALDELEAEMEEAPVKVLDYSMSKVSGISDGLALPKQSQMEMLSLRGNTIAWNQKINPSNLPQTQTVNGITFTRNADGSITINGTSTDRASFSSLGNITMINGHKYLVSSIPNMHVHGGGWEFSVDGYYGIITNDSATGWVRVIYDILEANKTFNNVKFFSIIIDLTLAYPTDTPTTLTDLRVQWCINYALEHPEFASKLVDVGLSAYETTGRNLFDGNFDNGHIIFVPSVSGKYTISNPQTLSQIDCYNQTTSSYVSRTPNVSQITVDLIAGNSYLFDANDGSWGAFQRVSNLMLNAGSTALPYEPYVKHTYPCLWNGKSAGSVQDEKLANGKEKGIVGSYTFTGNENWSAVGNGYRAKISGLGAKALPDSSTKANAIAEKVIVGSLLDCTNTTGLNCVSVHSNYIYIGSYTYDNRTTLINGTKLNYELATPTETDSDPLPNAIAVYQGGTEWQINDGAPCGIYKDYDISIKDQVLTNVKVDARQEEEIEELRQADYKSLYNLGEFDTVDTSNKDYDLVTRNGWYFNLSKFVLDNASSAYFRSTVSGYQLSPLGQDQLVFPSAYIESDGTPVFADNSVFVPTSANGCYGNSSGFVISHQYISLPSSYNTKQAYLNYFSQNEIIIQYRLATPYTEKAIKNRPLDTLDQQGSMFVRKEWEKGLQLWDGTKRDGYYYSVNGTYQEISGQYCTYLIKVKPNTTYTVDIPASVHAYNSSGTWLGLIADGASGATTFTTPTNTDTIGINMGTYTQIMLVEGSHPYPYQPYNGDIVREKELETKQDTLVSGTNIKTIGGQSILGSGNIDVGAQMTEFTAAEVDALFA